MTAPAPKVSAFRLRFIDMARAVAILLMLEGHFVDVTLALEWRNPDNPAYAIWHHCRGIAAPMFFTVTGLIFTYLLSGVRERGFLKTRRVKRGLLRACELLVWGYLLQVNLKFLPELFRGEWNSWMQAFHVLPCIAVGLFFIIAIYGICRRGGPRVLIAVYLGIGLLTFLTSVLLANHVGYLPQGAPAWLQNPIKGPLSVFPLAPWLSYTFYGAAIGVFIRHKTEKNDGAVDALGFLALGTVLKITGWSLSRIMGKALLYLTGSETQAPVLPGTVHGRIGEILIILGVLVWIENRFRPGASWFQTIGRNTFPIYVGHVIILYGGLFGIGLTNFFSKSLNPWQAFIGAILFCGFFGLCAQFVEPLTLRWKAWLAAGPWKKKNP